MDKLAEKIEGIRTIASYGTSVIDAGLIISYLRDEITLEEAIKVHDPFQRRYDLPK